MQAALAVAQFVAVLPLLTATCAPGEYLTCTAKVTNTGNVRLSSIVFTGDANCTAAESELLLPQQFTTCSFSKNSSQDDFEAGSISRTVSVTASPLGTNHTELMADSTYSTSLQQKPHLAVKLVRIVGSEDPMVASARVSRANATVFLLVTASNTGNVRLRNVTLSIPDLALSCPSTQLLEVDRHIECNGSFQFNQDTFEAGNKSFMAEGTASELSSVELSDPVMVEIDASPGLQVDVDANECLKPSRMCEWCCCSRHRVHQGMMICAGLQLDPPL